MLLKISKIALCPLILFACLAGIAHAAGSDITTHVYGAKKQALNASTDTVKAGYYSATALHAVEQALKPENIAVSTAIFGIAGTYAGPPRRRKRAAKNRPDHALSRGGSPR